MAPSISFIINPAAGFGKTKKRLNGLIKEIRAQTRDAQILLTRHPLHAIGLTKQALKSGSEKLVVIGGDGTLNEVVNGYFDKDGAPHNENAAIAIVPSGSGSDFYRSLDFSYDSKDAINFAINGTAKPTDIGLVVAHDANGQKVSRHFINVSSLGMSGLVAGFMNTVTKSLGPRGAYFMATIKAIRAFSPPTLRFSSDGMSKTIENCSLVSFANGKFFGSGMKIAPHAKLDDGLFDVITIEDLGVTFFLVNGYRIYQGTHLDLHNIHEYHQKECFVESLGKDPIYIETDGELFAELPAKYSVRRHVLKMVR